MKKSRTFGQFLDVLLKVFATFVVVLGLYFASEFIESFAFDYFIFPFISIIAIFLCGISVGRSLERIKNNEAIGYFTKKRVKNKKYEEEPEFVIQKTTRVETDKKIIKEIEEGEKIHIKALNFDDLFDDFKKKKKR